MIQKKEFLKVSFSLNKFTIFIYFCLVRGISCKFLSTCIKWIKQNAKILRKTNKRAIIIEVKEKIKMKKTNKMTK